MALLFNIFMIINVAKGSLLILFFILVWDDATASNWACCPFFGNLPLRCGNFPHGQGRLSLQQLFTNYQCVHFFYVCLLAKQACQMIGNKHTCNHAEILSFCSIRPHNQIKNVWQPTSLPLFLLPGDSNSQPFIILYYYYQQLFCMHFKDCCCSVLLTLKCFLRIWKFCKNASQHVVLKWLQSQDIAHSRPGLKLQSREYLQC